MIRLSRPTVQILKNVGCVTKNRISGDKPMPLTRKNALVEIVHPAAHHDSDQATHGEVAPFLFYRAPIHSPK